MRLRSPLCDLDNLPTDDAGRAELALLELLRIMYGPVNERIRLHAANVILRYCAPLPIRRCCVTLGDMTAWLDQLAEKEGNPR